MKFFSKHPEYSLLYKPENRIFTPQGEKIVLDQVKFIEFHIGNYATNDIDEIQFLLHSPAYGKDIYSEVQPADVRNGNWIKIVEKLIEKPVDVSLDVAKLKEQFKQTGPKVITHDAASKPVVMEEVKPLPGAK